MKIAGTNYAIIKNRQGEIWYDFGNGWKRAYDPVAYAEAEELIRDLKDKTLNQFDSYIVHKNIILAGESAEITEINYDKKSLAQKMIDFFSEFHFEPNFRFINTMVFKSKESSNGAQEYVKNYFKLIDSEYSESVIEKVKSTEFKSMSNDMVNFINPSKKINQRFKLYYGSQGTGKTTEALKEADECMVCHSAMLPQDLMEDFKFEDGKPGFNPSALYRAMVTGQKIVLDEINLLPFESLRFLQSILDGKESFNYKGNTIYIKEGFQIIGTMNLVVNGCVYALPEPLIDRAEDLKEFKLTSDLLVGAFE